MWFDLTTSGASIAVLLEMIITKIVALEDKTMQCVAETLAKAVRLGFLAARIDVKQNVFEFTKAAYISAVHYRVTSKYNYTVLNFELKSRTTSEQDDWRGWKPSNANRISLENLQFLQIQSRFWGKRNYCGIKLGSELTLADVRRWIRTEALSYFSSIIERAWKITIF